jgi:glycosyltransferase involved in cell wall biosynthesis
MPALSKAINSLAPDIVHSHSAMSSIPAAAARWRHRDAVFIHTMHASREWGTGLVAAMLQQALTRFAFPLSFDAETGVSAQNTQIVNETVAARLRRMRALRIPNAIDINELARAAPSSATPDRGVVGAVGRLDPVKGFDRLINAIPLVKASVPEAKVVLVGSGPAGDALAAQARRLGLGPDDIQFVGQQMNIVDWMRRMEILVQPSRAEGLPTVTLEAMALDLPIIASSIPAFREIIQQDWNGRLCAADDPVELARQIVALLGDPGTRGRLAANGRETARAYDIRAISAQYAALYEDLTRSRGEPSLGQRP